MPVTHTHHLPAFCVFARARLWLLTGKRKMTWVRGECSPSTPSHICQDWSLAFKQVPGSEFSPLGIITGEESGGQLIRHFCPTWAMKQCKAPVASAFLLRGEKYKTGQRSVWDLSLFPLPCPLLSLPILVLKYKWDLPIKTIMGLWELLE